MRLSIVLTIALAASAIAQERPGVPEGLPWARGVYLRAGSDWVGLPVNPLLPFAQGTARWLLGFGQSDSIAEMPGPHALIQTASAKPTFYMRGIPPSAGIYLVRSTPKDDYREIRMAWTGDFHEFGKFRAKDLVELDIRPVSGDIVTATPKTDLAPGEYAIVSFFEQNYRGVRASFDFGVTR